MQGFRDVELGDIKANEQFMNKIMDRFKVLTGWIQAADGWTTGVAWSAAKYYVDGNFDLEKGSDEYMMKVAEVYNRVIEQTQPNYTVLQRPDILRNPNAVMKQLTMFMTQRLQNTNILFDAVGQYSRYVRDFDAGMNDVTAEDVKTAKTRLIWATTSQILSAGMIVSFKALADAILHSMNAYRDDDKELTEESITKTLLWNFAETLASSVLWGSEIFAAMKSAMTGDRYYGVSLSGIDNLSDAVTEILNEVKYIKKDDKSGLGKQTLKLAKALGSFVGMPVSSAVKWAEAIIYHGRDIMDGRFGSFEAGVDWLTDAKKKGYDEQGLKDLGVTEHDFAKILRESNTDGKGSTTQDEMGAYLTDAIDKGELTEEQARAIWRAVWNKDNSKTFDDWLAKNS